MDFTAPKIGRVLYMLEKPLVNKILDFVRVKPRTMQELSLHIEKNWRTAERYVDQITQETGFISTRTFREGTRGALKIIYWNALDTKTGSSYQQRLFEDIMRGRKKEDFHPFDIYQFVPEDKRTAYLEVTEFSKHKDIRFDKLMLEAKHQVLFFSGNLSWMELGPHMDKTLELLAKRGVSIKVLTKVDLTSQNNTKAMLDLNQRFGKDVVEIRHCEQPLRAIIIDDDIVNLKEVLSPTLTREVKQQQFMFFLIKDHEWIAWLQKVFWHLWSHSVDAQKRLDTLETLKKIKK
jgi:hypothetical protein